jgi:hypothetical protein
MKTASYVLLCLALVVYWSSCKKHDSTPKTNPGGGNTTGTSEFLVKVSSPEMADSTLFLYTDTTLRGFAQAFNYVGTPMIEGYFPVYVNGHVSALNLGSDTIGSSAAMLFNFLLYPNYQIEIASDQAGNNAYYDSLAYDGSGRLAYIYEYSGSPSGSRALSSVSQLTWDANNDVTQFLTADSLSALPGNFTFSATMTYDTQTNPYPKTQAAMLLALTQDEDYYLYLSAHNVLTAQLIEQEPGAGNSATEADTYTYTYDTAGNPVTSSKAATVKGVTVTTTQAFTYSAK